MKSPQSTLVCLRSFALITIFLCSARYVVGAAETLFTTQVPRRPNVRDTNRELGARFTTSVGGHIIAIRFWKSSNGIGSHVQSGLTYYMATAFASNGTQSVFSSEISATIP